MYYVIGEPESTVLILFFGVVFCYDYI